MMGCIGHIMLQTRQVTRVVPFAADSRMMLVVTATYGEVDPIRAKTRNRDPLPDGLYFVFGYISVPSDDRHLFQNRLGYDNAIEGVTVDGRKPGYIERMAHLDRKRFYNVLHQLARNESIRSVRQTKSSQIDLYGYLPGGSHAQEELVRRIPHDITHTR